MTAPPRCSPSTPLRPSPTRSGQPVRAGLARWQRCFSLTCFAALAVASLAWADAVRCPVDVEAEVRAVDLTLRREAQGDAVALAEKALAQCPGEPTLVRLLARAQAAAGNSGALRDLLRSHLESAPLDCESWSYLAWAELVANDPAQAWQALLVAGCPSTPQEASRWLLVEALAHRYVGDQEAELAALRRLSDRTPLWIEDDRARAYLERQHDPSWVWPWQTKAELAIGNTTDAFAGSPTDTTTSGVGSAIADLSVVSTLRVPRTGRVVPFVEGSVRGHGIQKELARELSYLELGGRAGADVRIGGTVVTLAARREVLHLNQPSSLFSEAWRGELDVQTARDLVLFAGAGHRDFHDPWRTRTELDGGVAGAVRVGSLPLTLVLSGRRYNAERATYDQRGATLALVSRVPVGRGWLLRASVQGLWDDFPHSDTWEALIAFGSDKGRRDTTIRLSLGAWRALGRNLQGTLAYEYGQRWSTIEQGYQGSFSYTEHRVLASLRLDLSANPWRRGRTAADHVPIDWGLDPGVGPLGSESIRDIMRQTEELRTDCGCSGF